MNRADIAVTGICKLMASLPAGLSGRTRLARTLLSMVGDKACSLGGAYDIRYRVPSLAEPIVLGIVTNGIYEPETIKAIASFLPSDGLFMDIGANIGAISLPIAKLRPSARIISVEALPAVYQYLLKNIIDNNINNFEAIQTFIGSEDQSFANFYVAPESKFGMGSTGPQFGVEPISIGTRTIDSLILERALGSPHVVKLDIEGAEFQALTGAHSMLGSRGRRPVVIFESVGWAESRIEGQSAGEAKRLIESFGYSVSPLPRSPGMFVAKPLATH